MFMLIPFFAFPHSALVSILFHSENLGSQQHWAHLLNPTVHIKEFHNCYTYITMKHKPQKSLRFVGSF